MNCFDELEHSLIYAIKNKDCDMIELLVENGADICNLEVLYEVKDCKHRETKQLCLKYINKYTKDNRLDDDDDTIDLSSDDEERLYD